MASVRSNVPGEINENDKTRGGKGMSMIRVPALHKPSVGLSKKANAFYI